VRDIYLAM